MPNSVSFHSACLAFPELSEPELRELAADIRKNGLLNDIVRQKGRVIDGRNRFKACKLAGVKPRFVEWDGEGSPVQWIISQNLVRRHLTSSQRAIVALELLPTLEAEASERRGRRNGGKHVGLNGRATEIAAKMTKTNFLYVSDAKAIREQAPELISQIRCGTLGIQDAKLLAKLPRKQRQGVLRRIEKGELVNGSVRSAIEDTLAAETPASARRQAPTMRPAVERKSRVQATTLLQGDCRDHLKAMPGRSIDLVLCDPPYPEIDRKYGRLTESQWLGMMKTVVRECKRLLKPTGSAVFILQPNYETLGQMRLWAWEFVLWAGREMGLVQDAYWWSINAPPTSATHRSRGLLRQSVKWCVWLGPPTCYRNQDNVLWEPSDATKALNWSRRCLERLPSGQTVRRGRIAQTAWERGGVTPFNMLPLPTDSTPCKAGHPATTPNQVAEWWCRYLLPDQGVLLDPFAGSGTMLAAGLNCGASRVIGIENDKAYIKIARARVGYR